MEKPFRKLFAAGTIEGGAVFQKASQLISATIKGVGLGAVSRRK